MSTHSSPYVWFLLLDANTGLPYKNIAANKVTVVSSADVNDFRKAVKAEYPNKLSSVDADDLLIYKNKASFEKRNAAVHEGKEEPLDLSDSLDLLGSKDDMLVVSVQGASIYDKLKQLNVSFNIGDINYLFDNDLTKYAFLKSSDLAAWEAQRILTYAKSRIKSATQNAIGMQHSFYLDGSLQVGQGQAKSSMYYAYSKSGGVFVAKVYNGHEDDFQREAEASKVLDHKNLVKFIKTFTINDGKRHVIIMPFFPRSVADWLTQHSTKPLAAIKVIARNCFDALCHLHCKNFCFADLKPSNIMLDKGEPGCATLVDYGAMVLIGSPLYEFTDHYSLDADKITATENLDWICLGTTLAQIGGFNISCYDRAVDLVNDVRRSTQDESFKNLILSCLQSPSSSQIESALTQFELLN